MTTGNGNRRGAPRTLVRHLATALKAVATRRASIECDRLPFHFQRVPAARLLNWMLVESSMYVKPANPWGWPTHLQVEPTNHCNLRCGLCPVTDGMDRPSGFMDEGVFSKVIDEIGDYVFLLMLWDWGEPLLHRSLCDMIAYARRKGIKVLSSTNGHGLDRAGGAERLVRSGLDALVVAVDGISQETYRQYRDRGDLATVVRGVRLLVETKRRLGSPTPLVNLRFVVMRHNEQELPEVARFAESLGVDALTVRTLHPHDAEGLLKGGSRASRFLPQDRALQRYARDQQDARVRRAANPCKKLWNSATIHWSGAVCPCCFDPHDRWVLGNVTETTFRDIWRGGPYRDLRRRFRAGSRTMPPCADCSEAFEGGSLGTDDIIDTRFFTA